MKKSYGKVRRYRTAFGHTAGFWVRRVGLLAAAVTVRLRAALPGLSRA